MAYNTQFYSTTMLGQPSSFGVSILLSATESLDVDKALVATALTGFVVVHTVGSRVKVSIGVKSVVGIGKRAKQRAGSLKPIPKIVRSSDSGSAQNLSFLKKKSTLGCFSLSGSGLLYRSVKTFLSSSLTALRVASFSIEASLTDFLSSSLPNSPPTWKRVGNRWL